MIDSMTDVAAKLRDRAKTVTDPVEAGELYDMADALDLCKDGIGDTIAAGDEMAEILESVAIGIPQRGRWLSTSRQTQAQTFGTRPPSVEGTA